MWNGTPSIARMAALGGCVLAVLLIGCRTARMPLPETLATAERYPVEGRQGWKVHEQLRFGPFEAHGIERSWVRGGDLEVIGLEFNRRGQQYAFTLHEDGHARWEVACEASLRRRIIDGEDIETTLRDRSRLDCTFRTAGAAHWTLALTDRRDRPLEGSLEGAGGTFVVRGTRKLQGGLPADFTTGYEILVEQRPVAAVEVVGDGAVWLSTDDERSVMAAVAAALLLLEDLRAHLPA